LEARRHVRGRSRRAQSRVKSGDHQVAGSGTAAAQSQWTAAFVQRLRELGWTEGRNVAIEYRWGEGRTERFAELQASSHKPAAVDHQN
jgi:putative ABC transport system substrate-binding protein